MKLLLLSFALALCIAGCGSNGPTLPRVPLVAPDSVTHWWEDVYGKSQPIAAVWPNGKFNLWINLSSLYESQFFPMKRCEPSVSVAYKGQVPTLWMAGDTLRATLADWGSANGDSMVSASAWAVASVGGDTLRGVASATVHDSCGTLPLSSPFTLVRTQ